MLVTHRLQRPYFLSVPRNLRLHFRYSFSSRLLIGADGFQLLS